MLKKPFSHELDAAKYEHLVRERFANLFQEPEFEVVGGASTFWDGHLSGIPRQIDVGVFRLQPVREPYLVADAKRHGARLDVGDVDAFVGFMQDVRCSRGVLASLLGGSAAAMQRAASSGIELHVVSYAEALSFDWQQIAAGLYPWDSVLQPELGECLRLLNRGKMDAFFEVLESLMFEEWVALFTHAPANVRLAARRALVAIAESHDDDAWRFNALQTMHESYSPISSIWLRERLAAETDHEIREFLQEVLEAP